MARRGLNSHQRRLRELPHVARLHRKAPLSQADEAELKAVAGWAPADVDFKLIHFATPAEAAAMQTWIAESRIETRPAPEPYRGPQLTVTGGTTR